MRVLVSFAHALCLWPPYPSPGGAAGGLGAQVLAGPRGVAAGGYYAPPPSQSLTLSPLLTSHISAPFSFSPPPLTSDIVLSSLLAASLQECTTLGIDTPAHALEYIGRKIRNIGRSEWKTAACADPAFGILRCPESGDSLERPQPFRPRRTPGRTFVICLTHARRLPLPAAAKHGKRRSRSSRSDEARELLAHVLLAHQHGRSGVLAGPWLASTGSSDCISRRGAALRTREKRPITSDPSGRPCLSSWRPPESPFSLRLTLQAHVPVVNYNFWPKVVYVAQMLRAPRRDTLSRSLCHTWRCLFGQQRRCRRNTPPNLGAPYSFSRADFSRSLCHTWRCLFGQQRRCRHTLRQTWGALFRQQSIFRHTLCRTWAKRNHSRQIRAEPPPPVSSHRPPPAHRPHSRALFSVCSPSGGVPCRPDDLRQG